ncbi:hypothetical protein [Phaeobacter italicus]|jgi:hypothetical protein|uniref:hypothetical protein n=1 Tax=Phaeobacter italicus TaxID=481446 RepID=UPI002FDE9857
MAGAKLKKGDILAISDSAQAAMPADNAAFELLTMIPVSNVVTAPSFGYTTNVQRHNYLDTVLTNPEKGFSDGADSQIVYGIDPDGDAGQTQMVAASSPSDTGKYVISITRLDGTVTYAWGLISSAEATGGGGEDFNERTHNFVQAALEVTYTPTP